MTTAYPLAWPEGWPETPSHARDDGARFKTGNPWEESGGQRRYVGKSMISFETARRLLYEELERLHAGNVVLSSNLPLRLDGQARAGAALNGQDPGVAIYFSFKGKPMVMACDRFSNVAANVRSLGLAIEAMRQLDRHGGGQMMERAFAGFTALPPPSGSKPRRPWWTVLRYSADPEEREFLSPAEIDARYRHLAKIHHPDKDGGSNDAMAELSEAREDALAAVTPKG